MHRTQLCLCGWKSLGFIVMMMINEGLLQQSLNTSGNENGGGDPRSFHCVGHMYKSIVRKRGVFK